MSAARDRARTYSRENSERFQDQLFQMLRIPSLSGDPDHAKDIQRMANWLVDHMKEMGLQNVASLPTAGHPVAYGEWLGAGPTKETLLVYGHYDVVPAVMEDGWETDPFEPVVIDSDVSARTQCTF